MALKSGRAAPAAVVVMPRARVRPFFPVAQSHLPCQVRALLAYSGHERRRFRHASGQPAVRPALSAAALRQKRGRARRRGLFCPLGQIRYVAQHPAAFLAGGPHRHCSGPQGRGSGPARAGGAGARQRFAARYRQNLLRPLRRQPCPGGRCLDRGRNRQLRRGPGCNAARLVALVPAAGNGHLRSALFCHVCRQARASRRLRHPGRAL